MKILRVLFHYGLIRMLIERKEKEVKFEFHKGQSLKIPHWRCTFNAKSCFSFINCQETSFSFFGPANVTFCKLWNLLHIQNPLNDFLSSCLLKNAIFMYSEMHSTIFCSSDARKSVLLRELIVKPKLHFISSANRSKKMSQMSTKNQQINFRTDKVTVHFAALAT